MNLLPVGFCVVCAAFLQGVFIANQLTATGLDGRGLGGMKIKPTVLTKITYNGGGNWQLIKAPTTFNSKKCDRCGGATECSLHLHGGWLQGAALVSTLRPGCTP